MATMVEVVRLTYTSLVDVALSSMFWAFLSQS